MSSRIWPIVLFWVGFCGFGSAQEVPRIRSFAPEQYQGQNQNWSLCQRPDRLLCVGNSAGMLLFDGARWEHYPLPEKQLVRSVACDSRGRIYAGGYGEFGYWEANAQGLLEYHSLSKQVQSGLVGKEEIWHILVRPQEVLFQSFSTIYRYDFERIHVINPPFPHSIMFVYELNGALWVQVRGKGLMRLEDDNRFSWVEGSAFLADYTVVGILPGPQDQLMVCTAQNGIFLYEQGKFSAWQAAAAAGLGKFQLNKALRLSSGHFAFGTILNGLFMLDAAGATLYRINRQNGLQNNTVLSMAEDAEGNLWLGLDRGIDLIELNSPLTFFKDQTGHTGTVYAASLYQGQLYIGTNHGLYVRNPATGTFDLIAGSQGQVWDLQVVDGQLWCGHNEGTFRLNGRRLERLSPVTGGWCLRPHPQIPGLRIQGTYTGLAVFRKTPDAGWQYSHKVSGIQEPLKKIEIDKTGAVWAINAYKGLYHIRLDSGLRQAVQVEDFARVPLPSRYNLDLIRRGEKIWVKAGDQYFEATAQGLLIPRGEVAGIATPTAAKLIPGMGNEVFEVHAGYLRWHRPGGTLTFSLALVPMHERVVMLDAHTYLFCLTDGYALLDARTSWQQAPAPAPMIRGLQLLDGSQRWGGVFGQPQAPLMLPASQRNLRFDFAVPTFTRPVLYRYQLLGLDPEWSSWSSQPHKAYTNLPSGRLSFRLQSDISPHTAVLHLYIAARWYETAWARLLYAALAALLLYAAWQLHNYRLRRHRRRMEIQQARALHQQMIQARNEQLQADIRNKSQELANSTMNLVRKNEILMTIRQELKQIKAELGAQLPKQQYRRLDRLIERNISSEQDWQLFETNFSQVHEQFLKQLKADFPELTPGDLKLAAYLRMNLSTKDIAPLLNISIRGVENKRYRLRKKMGLAPEDNLTEVLMKY